MNRHGADDPKRRGLPDPTENLSMADKEIELPEGIDIDTAVDVLREFARTENAQIYNSNEVETLEQQVDEFLDVFRADLQERKDLAEATVEGMSVDALTAEYRNEEGEIEFTTLNQTPETGDPGETPSSSENVDTLVNEISEDIDKSLGDKDHAIEVLETRYERFDEASNEEGDTWARKRDEAENRLEELGVNV